MCSTIQHNIHSKFEDIHDCILLQAYVCLMAMLMVYTFLSHTNAIVLTFDTGKKEATGI